MLAKALFHGQVRVALPVIVIAVPLLALALATMGTLPETPGAHWTVAVLLPVETTVAMVSAGLVGLETMISPEYGAVAGIGAGLGLRLNVPVAVKVTCPFGKVEASAVAGVTEIERRTRPRLGLPLAQETSVVAARVIAAIAV
jgi:hypothetical protein